MSSSCGHSTKRRWHQRVVDEIRGYWLVRRSMASSPVLSASRRRTTAKATPQDISTLPLGLCGEGIANRGDPTTRHEASNKGPSAAGKGQGAPFGPHAASDCGGPRPGSPRVLSTPSRAGQGRNARGAALPPGGRANQDVVPRSNKAGRRTQGAATLVRPHLMSHYGQQTMSKAFPPPPGTRSAPRCVTKVDFRAWPARKQVTHP